MGRIFEKRKYSIFKTAAQNSKLYSKYSKQLYMAAKNGVPDANANPVLRIIVERAKKENVPSHVIDKAIQKAAGAGGENYQPARYEGVGPGGSLVIVDCLTDNTTRTISDVRNCFTKTGAKMSANGSVAMLFDHLAVISFSGDSEEKVLEAPVRDGRRRRGGRKQGRHDHRLCVPRRVLQGQNCFARGIPRPRIRCPGNHFPSEGSKSARRG